MTFCVSSFAALVKDAGYVLVLPPSRRENVIGTSLIAFFVLAVWGLKEASGRQRHAIRQMFMAAALAVV